MRGRGSGWGSRLVAAGVVAVAPAVMLSGCSWWGGEKSAPRPAATLSGPPKPAEEAWRLPISAIGQPVVVGDVAVVYTDTMSVAAIDPVKGVVLWSAPASPGVIPTGHEIRPGRAWTSDEKPLVTYLEPYRLKDWRRDDEDGMLSRVVVADPRTGKVLVRSKPAEFSDQPDSCDSVGQVCSKIRDEKSFKDRPFSLDIGTRALKPEPAPSGDVAEDMDGFVVLDDPAAVSRMEGDEVAWTLPFPQVFGVPVDGDGSGVSTVDRKRHVMVLTIGRMLGKGTHDVGEVFVTAAVDAKGKVLWRAPGTVTVCFGLRAKVDPEKFGLATAPVRCRYRGRFTSEDGYFEATKAPAPQVTVEGYDPATGRTTWSWTAGASKALTPRAQWDHPAAVAGPTSFLLGQAAAARVLDVVSGKAAPVRAGQTFVCSQRETFSTDEAYWTGWEWSTEHSGGSLATLCNANGRPAPNDPAPDLATLATVGARVKETVVLSTSMSVVGYR